MTVYVDEIRIYPYNAVKSRARRWGTRWCHMSSDSEDKAELHKIAKIIGHKRHWFEDDATSHYFHHYDLTPSRRVKALKAGAIQISVKDFVRKKIENDKQDS